MLQCRMSYGNIQDKIRVDRALANNVRTIFCTKMTKGTVGTNVSLPRYTSSSLSVLHDIPYPKINPHPA